MYKIYVKLNVKLILPQNYYSVSVPFIEAKKANIFKYNSRDEHSQKRG
jgi:hypothetical protein